ncbi:uncharacterized protein BP5553_01200 [Venustampulla echinocandica]|uniref:Uncharacterized protein n=1 Tax=Venustampulla echinocandica TaxID=2656787 RepID=A0A370U0C1_9HELO|nr:uncharacterized protein BP5553_01200 [Venustampulla echinocandica]RDL41221.1 hypothetical protein BP5553_01200 [Venustampulla echinocandica]
MAEQASELAHLDFVAHLLQRIKLVVWGEIAVAYLGVPAVHSSYMLGIDDDQMDLAAKKLAGAGFERQNWPFSSSIDPSTRKDDEIYNRIHAGVRPAYAKLDANSIRFQYPNEEKCQVRTVVLPASYIHLSIPEDPISPTISNSTHAGPSQPPFYADGNLYFPNVVMLLESMIKVILEDDITCKQKDWQGTLCGWVISYLYGDLTLRDDVLDGCQDDRVKQWFNRNVKRETGGMSRIREKWALSGVSETDNIFTRSEQVLAYSTGRKASHKSLGESPDTLTLYLPYEPTHFRLIPTPLSPTIAIVITITTTIDPQTVDEKNSCAVLLFNVFRVVVTLHRFISETIETRASVCCAACRDALPPPWGGVVLCRPLLSLSIPHQASEDWLISTYTAADCAISCLVCRVVELYKVSVLRGKESNCSATYFRDADVTSSSTSRKQAELSLPLESAGREALNWRIPHHDTSVIDAARLASLKPFPIVHVQSLNRISVLQSNVNLKPPRETFGRRQDRNCCRFAKQISSGRGNGSRAAGFRVRKCENVISKEEVPSDDSDAAAAGRWMLANPQLNAAFSLAG